MDNKYKIKLCNYFDKYGKCNNNNYCKFAHGENELRCLFDENCVNERCKRIHLNRDKNNEKANLNMDENLVSLSEKDNTRNINNEENKIFYSDIVKKEKICQRQLINLNNNNNNDNENIPIQLNINCIDVDDFDDIKENKIDIINLINNMETVFEKYNENIKQSINDKIKNNYLKYTLLNNLNEIKMEIMLFKNNYKDITELNQSK